MVNMITICPLETDHHADWLRLWKAYQAFYQVTIDDATTALSWQRLRDPAEPMFGRVALVDGKVAGIVHALYHRSTWTSGDYCYLQDLFTDETQRNRGIGRALIEAVYAEATARGASRVYWLTHETNATGIALYEKLASRTGFIQFRRTLQ
jgi:GNAT superfamily N-acetyltransferase